MDGIGGFSEAMLGGYAPAPMALTQTTIPQTPTNMMSSQNKKYTRYSPPTNSPSSTFISSPNSQTSKYFPTNRGFSPRSFKSVFPAPEGDYSAIPVKRQYSFKHSDVPAPSIATGLDSEGKSWNLLCTLDGNCITIRTLEAEMHTSPDNSNCDSSSEKSEQSQNKDYRLHLSIPVPYQAKLRTTPTCYQLSPNIRLTACNASIPICFGFESGSVVVFDPCNKERKLITMNKDGVIHAEVATHVRAAPVVSSIHDSSSSTSTSPRSTTPVSMSISSLLEENEPVHFAGEKRLSEPISKISNLSTPPPLESRSHEKFQKSNLANGSLPKKPEERRAGPSHLIAVAYADGTLLILDSCREDPPPIIMTASPRSTENAAVVRRSLTQKLNIAYPEQGLVTVDNQPRSSIYNPVSIWRVCKGKINSFAFSPCGKMIATATSDGYIKIINVQENNRPLSFKSYFGEVLSVCYSGDGKYIACGGQDDLVSVYSISQRQCLYRFVGHKSWVCSIAFDNFQDKHGLASMYHQNNGGLEHKFYGNTSSSGIESEKHDEQEEVVSEDNYRILSVGLDTRLILWEFKEKNTGNFKVVDETGLNIIKPLPWKCVPLIRPSAKQKIHSAPCTYVNIFEKGIITSAEDGEIKLWARPY